MSPDALKQIVRENIKARRTDNGVTQQALATAVGTTQAAIAQIERGHTSVSVEMLAKIADALGVQPSMLLIKDAFCPAETTA